MADSSPDGKARQAPSNTGDPRQRAGAPVAGEELATELPTAVATRPQGPAEAPPVEPPRPQAPRPKTGSSDAPGADPWAPVSVEPPLNSSSRPSGDEDGSAQALAQGTRVQRYILLKPVGQGGMGVVYAAYDPDLDRKVALKLLRSDLSHGSQGEAAQAGMLREAQAMARVSHPNVLSVYDVGTFGKQVFMAMEFIQGDNLSAWLRKQRPTWRQVLPLFLEAGRGLAAAHAAGLVHRDFKPSNVLVGKTGRVYVMDFGLAQPLPVDGEDKAADADADTVPEHGGRAALAPPLPGSVTAAGTPQYMPPEQYLGEVDARADQFSFCVALYLALYGKRPFAPRDVRRVAAEVLQSYRAMPRPADLWRQLPHGVAVRDDTPGDAQVPAWVRRVVLRGLSLHPEDRFASMEALLQALSEEQRRGKRRSGLAALGMGALALAGMGLYLYGQRQVCAGGESLVASVWGPANPARLEAAFVATGRPFALESARGVAQLLDGYARDWSRMHTQACEATRVRGEQTEELLSLRMVCLEARRKDLRALVDVLSEPDGKTVERAVDAAAALPSLQPCEDITSLAERPPLPTHPALRANVERLGEQVSRVKALHDAGNAKAALELARQLEAEVESTSWVPLRAELHAHLGWLLQQQGEVEQGIERLEQAFDSAELSRSDRLRLEVLNRLIHTFATHGHPAEARRWGKVAAAILGRIGGEAPLTVDLQTVLGNAAVAQGRYQEAEQHYSRARTLHESTAGQDTPKWARLTYSLGLAVLRQEDYPRAIGLLTEALQRTAALKGRQHPDVANRHTMLATAYRESGRPEQALPHVQAALEVRKATQGPRHPAVADSMDELGMTLIGLKRYDEAVRTFQSAVDLKTEVLGADHPDLSFSYDGIGQALLAQGKAAQALEPLRKALGYENTEPVGLAETGFALARALWEVKQPAQARQQALAARDRYAKIEKPKQVAEIDAWLAAHQEPPPEAPAKKKARPIKRRIQ